MKKNKLLIILFVIIVLLVIAIKTEKQESSDNSANEISGERQSQILLYFSNGEKTKLEQEYRFVNFNDIKENMLETVVKELIKGPTTSEFTSTIPSETKVNNIVQEGNKVIVDFSEEFDLETENESIELQKIYSVVNSLTEIKEVDEVEIRVNGKTIASEKRI